MFVVHDIDGWMDGWMDGLDWTRLEPAIHSILLSFSYASTDIIIDSRPGNKQNNN